MERIIKEIGSSISKVKDLLKSLNPCREDYVVNAVVAVDAFKSLLDADKEKLLSDICTKYKYFDARDAIIKQRNMENSKPVIKLLLALNIDSKNYKENAILALKEYSKLSPAETAIVLRNKASKTKLNEAKAMKVADTFLALDSTLGMYSANANSALNDYKNLYPEEKTLVNHNKKAYEAYSKAMLNSLNCLLMKFNMQDDNHLFIGRDALNIYEDLSEIQKEHINSNLFYRNKINMINMAFDKLSSDALIEKLHQLYIASLQSCLTSEYFTYALRIISEYEGSTTGAKILVEAQAALELQVAKDGKEAHPVVFLIESYLPEKSHSKYYEIADLLVAAYEFGLTKRQKRYVNKSIYTMELLDEAKEELTIEEKII